MIVVHCLLQLFTVTIYFILTDYVLLCIYLFELRAFIFSLTIYKKKKTFKMFCFVLRNSEGISEVDYGSLE